MIQRPIGLDHGEHCLSEDREWMCDDCRAGVEDCDWDYTD